MVHWYIELLRRGLPPSNGGESSFAIAQARGLTPLPALPPYAVRTPHLHGGPTTAAPTMRPRDLPRNWAGVRRTARTQIIPRRGAAWMARTQE